MSIRRRPPRRRGPRPSPPPSPDGRARSSVFRHLAELGIDARQPSERAVSNPDGLARHTAMPVGVWLSSVTVRPAPCPPSPIVSGSGRRCSRPRPSLAERDRAGPVADWNLVDDLVRPWIDQTDIVRLHAAEPAARATHEGGEQGDYPHPLGVPMIDDDRLGASNAGVTRGRGNRLGEPSPAAGRAAQAHRILERERAEPPGREARSASSQRAVPDRMTWPPWAVAPLRAAGDREADVSVALELGFPRVDAHPDFDLSSVRPRVSRKRCWAAAAALAALPMRGNTAKNDSVCRSTMRPPLDWIASSSRRRCSVTTAR